MTYGDLLIRKKLGELVSPEQAEKWWKPDLFEQHTRHQLPAELAILNPPPPEEKNFNCFVFAFGLSNNPDFLGKKNWDFMKSLDINIEEMIQNNLLKKKEIGTKGDLIVYRTNSGSISHVGLVDGDSMIRSKWSWGPLIRHQIWDVPDHYGNTIEFYNMNDVAVLQIQNARKNFLAGSTD